MEPNIAPTRELYWGLSQITNIEPQKKRFTAFAIIHDSLFCSSDGFNTYFWNENGLIKTIELGAIALHYIKPLNHVIASIKNSTHLHFIWIHDNYSIIVHPLSFSIRTITSLYYFPNSETLITAGQGLTFSKMKIPHFSGEGSFTKLIDFEKGSELYPDEIFTKIRNPLFIESEDSIVISIDKSIYIHSHKGELIGKMEKLMPGNITCLSYFEPHKLIVIGDEFGNVSFVEYGQFFTSIRTSLSNNVHLLMATLFDRNFLVTIGLDQSLTLINVKTEYRIQTIKLKSEIIHAETTQNKILAFSNMECLIYNVSIFTHFFANLTNNAIKIERHMQPHRPALLVCLQKDSIISTFSPKTSKKYCEFASSSFSSEVSDFLLKDNQIFFQFKHGNFLRSKLTKKETIISLQNDDFNPHSIKVPASVTNVVQIIRYDSAQQGESILALSSTGHIYSFSIETRKVTNTVYIGCSDIICGVYSSLFEIFIISTKTKIVVVDSEKLTVTKRIEGGSITAFYIDDTLLFSGDANGYIELRDLPSFKVKANSRMYNGFHSDNGSRKPLAWFNSYSDIPHAVKYLHFLRRREMLLSVSNQGEIFLWTMNLFPYCHTRFSYEMLAATFFDSNGSLIVSSFDSLFIIPYTYLFDKPVQDEIDDLQENQFDEFNTFEEIEEIKKKKPKKIHSTNKEDESLLVYDRFQYHDKQAYIQKEFEKQKSSFWMEPDTDMVELEEAPFEDLIVDLESIPKCHFVSFDEANNRRKVLEKNPKPHREFKKKKKTPSIPEAIPNEVENKPRMPKSPPILTKQAPRKNRHSSSQKGKKKATKKPVAQKKEPEQPKPIENQIKEPIAKPKPKNYLPAYLQQSNPNYAVMRRTTNTNLPKSNQPNQPNSKDQLGTKPVFTIEAKRRNVHNNSELSTTTEKDIEIAMNLEEDEDELLKNRRITDTTDENERGAYTPQIVEFVEPKFDGNKIPTVTMEELNDYMAKNTVFLRDSRPGSTRRSRNNIFDGNRSQRYPKVSRVPKNEPKRTFVHYNKFF